MTNTKLNATLTALRATLEADKAISEDARGIVGALLEEADEDTTVRDLLNVLEDGEALAALFADEPEEDEETVQRHIAIVEEAYTFIEDFGY